MQKYYNTYFLITGIILIAVIIGLVVLAVQTSANFTTNRNNISTLQSELSSANSQISSLTDQLETAYSQIKTLQYDTSANGTKISSLNTDLSLAKSQLSSLTNVVNTVNAQISTLQTSTSSAASSILSLQTDLSAISSQLTVLQSTLTSLQSTVTSLTARVDSLEAATNPTTLFSLQTISQSYNTQTTLTTFTPTYFGYLYISGISSSSTGYFRIYNNTLSNYTDYTFGIGTTVTATVTAGYSYSIIFGNTDSSGTITATLSATYYPY